MRLLLQPMPAPRPRVANGHAYMPKTYKNWLDECAWLARLAWGKPALTGPVKLSVVFEPDGIEVQVVETDRPRFGRGDIDNLVKALLDGLVAGGVLVDDRLVVELEARFG